MCVSFLAKIRFIEPMYARLVNELPEGKDWLYEVKFDGYRCLDGHLRHSRFVGLREDKDARGVLREG